MSLKVTDSPFKPMLGDATPEGLAAAKDLPSLIPGDATPEGPATAKEGSEGSDTSGHNSGLVDSTSDEDLLPNTHLNDGGDS